MKPTFRSHYLKACETNENQSNEIDTDTSPKIPSRDTPENLNSFQRNRRRAYPQTPLPLSRLHEEGYQELDENKEMSNMNFQMSSTSLSTSKENDDVGPKAEIIKLQVDKKKIRDELAPTYPVKYKAFTMYEEVVRQESSQQVFTPPGWTERDFLLYEKNRILRDIYSLREMMKIAVDNKQLKLEVRKMEKSLEPSASELKTIATQVSQLETKMKSPNITLTFKSAAYLAKIHTVPMQG